MKPIPSFYFLPSTVEDAYSIGLRLCEGDALEARLMTGKDPAEATVDSYLMTYAMSGEVMTCWINGSPEMIFGIRRGELLSDNGIVWMLHTDVPARWGLMFAKYSRTALANLFDSSDCRRIENFVLADNVRTIRWLQFLGFKFDFHFIMSSRRWLHFYMSKEADNGCCGRA